MTNPDLHDAVDAPDAEEGGGLPLDLRALAIGLWQRRMLLVLTGVVSLVLGVALAVLFTERVYTAETVLLYTAPMVEDESGDAGPSLFTQMNMVKLRSNLEEVRNRLSLAAPIKGLGAAISVELQRKTALVSIRVKWTNARDSAAIANTVRDVFLEGQTRIRREDLERRISDLENRLAPVRRELEEADTALKDFTTEHTIVDLAQEAQWTLEEKISLNLLYEQAKIDQQTIHLQAANLDPLIAQLEEKVSAEQGAQAAKTDALSEMNLRAQRLRESIQDDRDKRAYLAELEAAQSELVRAEEHYLKGIVSQAELDEARAEYESLRAKVIDTPQIKNWKEQLSELDKALIPEEGEGGSPSGNLLVSVMSRAFEVRLQQVAVDEKVESLAKARQEVENRLNRMPALQRRHAELTRTLQAAEAEAKILDEKLAEAKRMLETASPPFTVVAEAETPEYSSQSNRKTLFAAVVVLVNGAGFLAVLLLVLGDITLKTGKELTIRTKLPALAEIPDAAPGAVGFPTGPEETVLVEDFRILARHLRTLVPKKGGRILFVSTGHDEGTTFVAANLAAVFGRTDEHVLLIDAQVRPRPDAVRGKLTRMRERLRRFLDQGVRFTPSPTRHDLLSLVEGEPAGRKGLGEYLSFEAADLGEVVSPTLLPGVSCIPRVGASVIPDMLSTLRMKQLLDEASGDFSLVMIDAPPALSFVDAQALAEHADAVVLVVRAHGPYFTAVRQAVERFERNGIAVLGAVLNRVSDDYSGHPGR
ncbi:MAG: hypothetical protein PWP23_2675 [Candidatus Sumerlaeota bacterium]|nr:hypothetical protein [Candidatus Sumerlaeota bacterium]